MASKRGGAATGVSAMCCRRARMLDLTEVEPGITLPRSFVFTDRGYTDSSAAIRLQRARIYRQALEPNLESVTRPAHERAAGRRRVEPVPILRLDQF